MRMRFTSGPASDTRPNTAIHRGSSAAATATLPIRRIAPPRASHGQVAGTARSAAPPAHMIAAQAPTLISALGDSAAAGSTASRTAAAKVKVAVPVVSRPSARAPSAAASMSQARTHGGSAPVIKV
ncbi:MAG: hypothetical protein HY923_07675 [Elusimicrobia bacterium]|nr:hypothetical protein [Elusimicrobiota bacterium]